MQKAINFNDFAIASIKGSDYRIQFWYMSKNDAIRIMNNSNLNEKVDYLFFYYIWKWVEKLIKEIEMWYKIEQIVRATGLEPRNT